MKQSEHLDHEAQAIRRTFETPRHQRRSEEAREGRVSEGIGGGGAHGAHGAGEEAGIGRSFGKIDGEARGNGQEAREAHGGAETKRMEWRGIFLPVFARRPELQVPIESDVAARVLMVIGALDDGKSDGSTPQA